MRSNFVVHREGKIVYVTVQTVANLTISSMHTNLKPKEKIVESVL